MNDNVGFFYGANTPRGFCSFFDSLYDPHEGWFAYILKGGPGTGKSGLMRSVTQQLIHEGFVVETVPCASDPSSLDAVLFPEKRVCIVDGTAPHTLEPRFPGAADCIVNLGEFWSQKALWENAAPILDLTARVSAMHKRCVRFLDAAASLKNDGLRLSRTAISAEKLERYASRLTSRELGAPTGKVGREQRRFLGAVTPEGVTMLTGTLSEMCDKIYLFDDDCGAAAESLISLLRSYALGNGHEVISCPCPLAPDGVPEHLILPQARLAFCSLNRFHRPSFDGTKTVSLRRFYLSEKIKEHRARLLFGSRSAGELIEEAAESLREAKKLHDELEAIYIEAMDFEKVDRAARRIAREILDR